MQALKVRISSYHPPPTGHVISNQTLSSAVAVLSITALYFSIFFASTPPSAQNFSTISTLLPVYSAGFVMLSSSLQIGLKNSVFLIRSTRSFSLPSFLTLLPAWWDRTRICSWASCRDSPLATSCIIMLSVIMNGSSSMTRAWIRFG